VAALVILGGDVTALAVARDATRIGLTPIVYAPANDLVGRSRLVRLRPTEAPGTDAALEALLSDAAREGSAALIACSDQWLQFIVRHRAQLGRRFAAILHPDNAVLELCLSKRRFSAWAQAHRFPTPEVIEEPAAQAMLSSGTIPFPLLLRPEFSLRLDAPAAPTKAVEVKTAAELGHWMHEFAQARCPVLITRSLLGTRLRQFSVAVARKGGVVRSFVAEKLRPHAQQRAVGTYVRLAPHPAAESLARDLLARMSFEGLAEVEVLTDAAGDHPSIIEVNARPWSQFALASRSGNDFLRLLLDQRAPAQPRTRGGLAWIDFSGDLYMCFSKSVGLVRKGEVTLSAYLGSLLRANVFARFSPLDPGPALHDLRRLWRRGSTH
jgi:predicted ATP-grasp superfamily ATP-dependent carboligase